MEIIYEIYNKHIDITKLYRKTPKLSNYIVFFKMIGIVTMI